MSPRAADLLPDRRTELWLRPPRTGRAATAIVCILFAAASGVALYQGDSRGRFGLFLFGAGAVLAAIGLHPRAAYLHATIGGLTIGIAFRTRRFAWSDIEALHVVEIRRSIVSMRRHVVLELRGGALAQAREQGDDPHYTIPTSFGLQAEDLALVLHAWRARALTSEPHCGDPPAQ